MFERFSRSWNLALASFNVIRQDKQLVLFPILSCLATVLVFISFLVPTVYIANAGGLLNEETNQPYWWAYLLLFAFYFVSYFVVIFFNAALVFCALMRFRGEQPTLGAGFAAAGRRLPAIFAWAFVAATVGLLLKLIENANERVGQIVASVLGLAWSVVTYFVVPVLVVENVGPIEAVKRSVGVMTKTWGEGLIGNAGLGLVSFLLALPGLAILLGAGYLLGGTDLHYSIGLSVLGLGLIVLLLAAAVSSALGTIFQAALYQYAGTADKQVPVGFQRIDLDTAFRTSKVAA